MPHFCAEEEDKATQWELGLASIFIPPFPKDTNDSRMNPLASNTPCLKESETVGFR
jgi:hypothetical protein